MSSLSFVKMQGLGNDFVVLDGFGPLPDLTPELLRHLADRRLGVGCDQILVADPAPDSASDVGYRIYNADGSTVGQCGNGVRCLALYLARRKLSAPGALRVATATTRMTVELLDDEQVRVEMAVPDFAPQSLPFRRERAASYAIDGIPVFAVSLGNPHLVTRVADIDEAPVAVIGQRLATHADVPEGANVGFAQIISPNEIRLRVYERGVGETPACGSGACGAVAALIQDGQLNAGAPITVRLPGGTLTIEWAGGEQPLYMTGPAMWVFEGRIPL